MSSRNKDSRAAPTGRSQLEIGCQGWNYDDWVTPAGAGGTVFYPRGTRAADMLGAYARLFETIEVDSTFYAVPSAATIENWKTRTPDDFTFSLKLPQAITHEHALRGEAAARVLSEFCERVRGLGDKLAAVLIQFPPQFAPTLENVGRLREFLPLLPREMRFAVEFRDAGWFDEATAELFARRT
ncbi:MAG: DUF72 domain-containing protein, partial [Pyrinomonadaceae bacterium]